MALLLRPRDKLLRLKAGVPEGVAVNLSLVKLPDDALLFPNPPRPGESFSFTALRKPRNTSKEFKRKATALGFRDLRLHDLRGLPRDGPARQRGAGAPRCRAGWARSGCALALLRQAHQGSAAATIGAIRRVLIVNR